MTYDEWEEAVHQRIKEDLVWRFFGYRKALFLYELSWRDCDKLLKDQRGKTITNQLIRSTGSISANIEEGFGRGFGKEYIYFMRVSIGSARETKGWYWRARQILSAPVVDHRLELLDDVISLIATEIGRQRKKLK